MCGRYYIAPEDGSEELENVRCYIESRYGKEEAAKMDTGEIFPSNYVPVILTAEGGYIARPMTWGFPGYQGKQLLINARAETAAEKPTFRDAIHNTRCIIPTSGFYEWTHDKKGKALEKYHFSTKGSPILYLAGLYKEFEDGARFVILTQEANEGMAVVHNRMPVVIRREQLADYINDYGQAEELLKTADPSWVQTAV